MADYAVSFGLPNRRLATCASFSRTASLSRVEPVLATSRGSASPPDALRAHSCRAAVWSIHLLQSVRWVGRGITGPANSPIVSAFARPSDEAFIGRRSIRRTPFTVDRNSSPLKPGCCSETGKLSNIFNTKWRCCQLDRSLSPMTGLRPITAALGGAPIQK